MSAVLFTVGALMKPLSSPSADAFYIFLIRQKIVLVSYRCAVIFITRRAFLSPSTFVSFSQVEIKAQRETGSDVKACS